jgi:hypothetical protein
MAPDSRPNQDGLAWEQTLFDLVPQWTRDPPMAAVESLCRRRLGIAPADPCVVKFAASGLFNKLYTVEPRGTTYMMRVSLPVYPRHKTRAEVATLRWVRDNTSVPVPKVYEFDDSNDNEMGFEWILVEFMDGRPAHERWWAMTMEQKAVFAQRIAMFQAELSGRGKAEAPFERIGTLTLDRPDSEQQKDAAAGRPIAIGRLVVPEFFMGDNLFYNVPRGPFDSSHDWLAAQLNIILVHQTAVLNKTEDEDEQEDAENALSVARKLLFLIPKVFPPSPDVAETTGLYHHDLHLNNILVSDQGEITAVLDWECVSALPLWMATRPPKFLDEPVREEEPLAEDYADNTPQEFAASGQEKNELYYIHRMEYEATQLRKVYEARLKELWPGWPLGESNAEVDFFQAVSLCDGLWGKRVGRWADRLERGEVVRLDDTA